MILAFLVATIFPIIGVLNDSINSEKIVSTLCKQKLRQLELNVLLLEKHVAPEVPASSMYAGEEVLPDDQSLASTSGRIDDERLKIKQKYTRFRQEI